MTGPVPSHTSADAFHNHVTSRTINPAPRDKRCASRIIGGHQIIFALRIFDTQGLLAAIFIYLTTPELASLEVVVRRRDLPYLSDEAVHLLVTKGSSLISIVLGPFLVLLFLALVQPRRQIGSVINIPTFREAFADVG
jgi:hypothetical protein